MLHFDSDYMEGACPEILERLLKSNLEKNAGYGMDSYCSLAKEKIRRACGCEKAEVYFLTGGTQTNSTVIAALLSQWEGVVAAETGHISVHEAGAVEYTGHKVLTLSQHCGKICPEELFHYLERFRQDDNREHMVFPGMVYISHPTEYGTLYSLEELEKIHGICKEYGIPLFVDGARLGYALAAEETDVTLESLARNCDVFYIGGTKVGALFGEAVVFTRPELAKHFFTIVKQHGALLAKGWLLGLQFDTLFTDNLYLRAGKNGVQMADRIEKIFKKKGYRQPIITPTNQKFIILENKKMQELSHQVSFGFWEMADDDHTVVRFAASWATRQEDVDALEKIL